MNRIKETELYIINFDKGSVWSKKLKREIGAPDDKGYLMLWFNGKTIRIHRFIYENYHNIKLTPKQFINHIDHNPLNNKIDNLNLVDLQRNNQYSLKTYTNKSGYKCVHWCKTKLKWICDIMVNGKRFSIKHSDKKEECIELYNEVCRYLNEMGFYYYIEGEEVVLQKDNRHLFNEEELKEFIKKITNRVEGCVFFNKNEKKWKSKYKSCHIGTYKTKEEGQEKLNLVLNHIKQYPDISVEDLKAFIKTIR